MDESKKQIKKKHQFPKCTIASRRQFQHLVTLFRAIRTINR